MEGIEKQSLESGDFEETSNQATTIIVSPAGTAQQVALAWLERATGERRYVQSEIRVGRANDNDVRLEDSSVSRYHAFVRRVDGRYLLSDLGSRNGTFVNGKQVRAPQQLRSGDSIHVGTTQFTFHVETVAARATP